MCFVAQMRGVLFARAGDNVVFVREPGNLFDPSCVKVGLCGQVCSIHCFGYLESRVTSIINLLGTLPGNAVKCSVFFLRIMQLLHNICDITMNRS